MSEKDLPEPTDLRARLDALARLSERLGPRDPRRRLLEEMLDQSLLFAPMSERLKLAPAESPLMQALLRELEFACLDCAARGRCRNWLDGHTADDYRDFCPNAGLLAVLPRSKKVEQEGT